MEQEPVVEATQEAPPQEVEVIEAEAPATEEVAAPEPPPKPTKLTTHRKTDGTLDEDRLEADLTAAEQQRRTLAFYNELENSDPEYHVALLKSLKKRGIKLPEEAEAKLAPPAPPGPTRADVMAKVREMRAAGEFEKADELWADYVTDQASQIAESAAEKRGKADDERRAREDSAKQAEAANAQRTEAFKAQYAKLHEDFPELVVKDDTLIAGYRITDTPECPLLTTMKELSPEFTGKMSMSELAEIALFKMKQLNLQPEPVAKPKLRTVPVPTAKKKELGKNEVLLPIAG